MANTVNQINLANTFGEWVTSSVQLINEYNVLASNDWTKRTGDFIIETSNAALIVQNGSTAIFQVPVEISGSSANLIVKTPSEFQGVITLSNTQTSMTASGNVIVSKNLVISGNVSGNVIGNVTGNITGDVLGNADTVTNGVYTVGNQTIGGTKTFSSTIVGNINGNAGTVTNGVYTSTDQTIGGTKTFTSTIAGNILGNAGTVTNGVYTTGNQTIGGIKTFSSTIVGSINGNAATVTNGVYTTGNQTIGGIKSFSSTIVGSINGNAGTVTNGVYTIGNQTIAGVKTFSDGVVGNVTGNVTGTAGSLSTASGSAPSYAARAFVYFNGTNADNKSGTYSQSGTTITVTISNHGFAVNDRLYLNFTSGTAVDAAFQVEATPTPSTFTVTSGTSTTTSGNITVELRQIVNARNVSSVSRQATGEYIVNFTTPMPDQNYIALVSSGANESRVRARFSSKNFRVDTEGSGGAATDSNDVNVVVFA
jgi:hypothetical protein